MAYSESADEFYRHEYNAVSKRLGEVQKELDALRQHNAELKDQQVKEFKESTILIGKLHLRNERMEAGLKRLATLRYEGKGGGEYRAGYVDAVEETRRIAQAALVLPDGAGEEEPA